MLLQVVFSLLVTVTTCWQRYSLLDGPKRFQWSAVLYAHKRDDAEDLGASSLEVETTEAKLIISSEIPTEPPEPTKGPSSTKEPTKKVEEEKEQHTTRQPMPTKEPFPTKELVPEKEAAPPSTFPLWGSSGKICLLAKFDASFTIVYSTAGAEQDGTVNLPKEPVTRGRCGTAMKDPELQISWPGFHFTMIFTKVTQENEGSPETWAVRSMALQYDTSQPFFDGATNRGKKTARTKEKDIYFETPMNMSYFCPSPEVIPLYNPKNKKVVTVRMKDVQLQAYAIKNGAFGSVHRCDQVDIGGAPEPYIQDETIPIAVGSTLAILTLLSVGGFAIYRAVTVRRVDYSTME